MMPALIGRVQSLPPWPEPPPDTRVQVLLAVAASLPLIGLAAAQLLGFGPVGVLVAFLLSAVLGSGILLRHRRRRLRRQREAQEARPDFVEAVFVSEPSNLEDVLPAKFATAQAVESLLQLGNLAVLAADSVVAYSRDYGEAWAHNQPQTYDAKAFRKCPPLVGQARIWYLHDGKGWLVKDGRDREDSWQARRAPWRELYGSDGSVSGARGRPAGERSGD